MIPTCLLVLVTGQPALETAAEAIEYGAFVYLVKPVNPETFVSTVERAARLYRLAQTKRQAIELFGENSGEADRVVLKTKLDQAISGMWMAFQPIVRASNETIFRVFSTSVCSVATGGNCV
jgi:DNA-binding NtrC family response regulator